MPDFDLAELGRYAQSKGVRLIGHHESSANIANYDSQMEAAFALYQSVGVRQVGRASKEWFLGAVTNESRSDLSVPLSFLEKASNTALRSTATGQTRIGTPLPMPW